MTANWLAPDPNSVSRRTTARVTPSAISLSSSSHLPLMLNSNAMKPVALPPGRAMLSTKPPPTGSATLVNTVGTVRLTCRNGPRVVVPWARMTSGASRNQLRRVAANLGDIGDGPAGVDPHVPTDRPIQHRQSLQERPDAGLKYRIARRCGHEHADAPHPLALLRTRHERPRRRA